MSKLRLSWWLYHSMTRNFIPMFFVSATVLVGCHSPSMLHRQTASPTVATPQRFHPMLITTLGTNTTPDGTWRIGVSETSVAFSRSHAQSENGFTSSGWTTASIGSQTNLNGGWGTHPGWFVFIETESRVWAYNGDRMLLLQTESVSGRNSHGTTYSNEYPSAVPHEVFSRLSEPAQKAVKLKQ